MQEKTQQVRFEQIVLPHLDAAYNLARWLTRNDQDAEDVQNELAASAAINPLLQLGVVQSQDIQKKPYYAMLEDAISPPPSLRLVGHS